MFKYNEFYLRVNSFIAMIGLCTKSAGKIMNQVRNVSVISGPPSNRMSFAEKCGHAFVSFCVMLIVPTYISVNLPYYKGVQNQNK